MATINMEKVIEKYFSKYDFNIRKRKNKVTTFTNQKCAPDVLNDISHIILDWNSNRDKEWNIVSRSNSKNSLWHYPLFSEIFVEKYKKGNPLDKKFSSEYDKILSQPHLQLVYAEILERNMNTVPLTFKIKNKKAEQILEFIAENMKNAFVFQNIFYQKVINDSNFEMKIKKYRDTDQNNISKCKKVEQKLRDQFLTIIKNNTGIKNKAERQRMYLKFINNLAVSWNIRGREKGSITNLIPRNFDGAWEQELLKYNKTNWYDDILQKSKNISRSLGVSQFQNKKNNNTLLRSRSTSAKKKIKRKYGRKSEHIDKFSSVGVADYRHHIIQQAHQPRFSDYLENIINITFEQHKQAHLIGRPAIVNYSKVNLNYQKKLLLSKLESIKKSSKCNEQFYNLDKFIEILNVKKPHGPGLNIKTGTSLQTIKRKLS